MICTNSKSSTNNSITKMFILLGNSFNDYQE